MKFLLSILLVGFCATACNNAADTATDATDNTEVNAPAKADTSVINPADTTLNRDTLK